MPCCVCSSCGEMYGIPKFMPRKINSIAIILNTIGVAFRMIFLTLSVSHCLEKIKVVIIGNVPKPNATINNVPFITLPVAKAAATPA